MKRTLKTYNVNTKVFFDSIVTGTQEKNGDCVFEYRCNDIFLTGRNNSPFMALASIREQLQERGLILLCEGARIDVYPSGMSSGSLMAYKTVMGLQGRKEDLVNILGPTEDIGMIGTLDQQKAYRDEWTKSLGTNPEN